MFANRYDELYCCVAYDSQEMISLKMIFIVVYLYIVIVRIVGLRLTSVMLAVRCKGLNAANATGLVA